MPAFKELYYLYDYGDDWCIHISMINKYDRSANADYQLPVCTKVDALNVMDDVGGISGLLNFYRIINGEYPKSMFKEKSKTHPLYPTHHLMLQ